MKSPIPILRSFDEAKAKEFYVDFLGFVVDWEHRFGTNCPLYMQLHQGECILHLSEHYGDAAPGSAIRIETSSLKEFCVQLRSKNYPFCRPGDPEMMPWGLLEIRISDPFGNHLTFYQVGDSETH